MSRLRGNITYALALLCLLLAVPLSALAAPERLGDEVPSAFPDDPGRFAFGWSYSQLNLEGALQDESLAHDYFRLKYTFNPKVAVTFRYGMHDLSGGLGLSNPFFTGKDSADSFNFDLALNLLHQPPTPADPAAKQQFAAGSAFNVGLSGTLFQMDMADLSEEESLLKAYLAYSTDLSPELRAHTIFSSGRLTGGDSSGSVNRVGAGLDYTLIDGKRPLVLMVDGVLDIYNFREPDFNTSRVSQFNVGLRYRFAEDWFASLAYTTHNDSENDASGSGIYASIQFVDMPSPPKPEPEPEPETADEQQPAAESEQGGDEADNSGGSEAEAPAETQASAPAPSTAMESPTLMASAPAVTESTDGNADVAELELATDDKSAVPGRDPGDDPAAGGESESDGVSIPEFPELVPRHTATTVVMVRAGRSVSSAGDTVKQDELLAPLLLDTENDLDELILTANQTAADPAEDEAGNGEDENSANPDETSSGTTVVAQDTLAVGSSRTAASVDNGSADDDTDAGEQPQDEDKEREDEEESAENTRPSSGKTTSSGG